MSPLSVVFAGLMLHGVDILAAYKEKESVQQANQPSVLISKHSRSMCNNQCHKDENEDEENEEDEGDEGDEGDEDEDIDNENEDNDEANVDFHPTLTGFMISEINNDWTFTPEENPLAQTFASIYTVLDLSLAPNFSLGLETSFETGNDGEFLKFKNLAINIEALTASYDGEAGGIGIGKYFLLDGIWNRRPGLFGHFISDDLDLDGVLAIRTWLNLGRFIGSEHYLYASVFFRDTTFLSGSLVTRNDRLLKDEGGLANTEQFNNGVISLHGDELPYASAWAYSLGFAHQSPGKNDSESENSYFLGLYGDFDLFDETEFFPVAELLQRTGANGEDQTATTFLAAASLQQGSWNFGTSYSLRYLHENDSSTAPVTDHNVQVFTSYNFPSGGYIDLGYQFIRMEKTNSHAVNLTVGLLFDFSKRFAAKTAGAVPPETDRNKIRQRIRR